MSFENLQRCAASIAVKARRIIEATALFHAGNDFATTNKETGIAGIALDIIQSRLINSAILEAYSITGPHRHSGDATLSRLCESINRRAVVRRLLEFSVEWADGDRHVAAIHVRSMRRQIQHFRNQYRRIDDLDMEALQTFRHKRLGHNSMLEDVGISYQLAWDFCDAVVSAAKPAVFIFSGRPEDWDGIGEIASDSYRVLLEAAFVRNCTTG